MVGAQQCVSLGEPKRRRCRGALGQSPKAETPRERKTHQEILDLLDLVVQQQVDSSMSRRREPETNRYTAFMPMANDATSR
jgi:hypothetical protein